ncbi:TetR/AcrR family transcriptional regulator [Streptomyces sp. MS19]|uniref:TetR/AcrR family transcriptional regulator n=1 Tax=Streptomyces sp. MS19 TaxID=3385972 RepID=UPI0039A1143E
MPVSPENALPLRERKKRRTRRELADTALRLFLDQGFEATTLDDLVDTVEISKRTFFRTFPSKEAVALAAETELWDAYLERVAALRPRGEVLTVLHEALTGTLAGMGPEWTGRFLATRGLAARTPALRDHSDLTSIAVQRRLVELLEDRLGIDSRGDVRLRLLGEMALAAWRCAAKNWVRSGPGAREDGVRLATLITAVDEAFAALPAAVTLGAD